MVRDFSKMLMPITRLLLERHSRNATSNVVLFDQISLLQNRLVNLFDDVPRSVEGRFSQVRSTKPDGACHRHRQPQRFTGKGFVQRSQCCVNDHS